ncbi:MAG: dUTP diphosphatase [Ruminococcaceae bacterium]|nr:dUTP diphosphatase [Oscillospiraceae bacterium]
MQIQVKMLREGARLPHLATAGAAACDLYALLEEPVTLQPGERKPIPTGIAIALPDASAVAVVCARSGLALKRGLGLANGIGVIDSDYRGELFVALINNDDKPQVIENGERIGQLMILPVIAAQYVVAEELDETARGAGGFGSTGTK